MGNQTEETSVFGVPSRNRFNKELPVFNPSDYKLWGYPHVRSRVLDNNLSDWRMFMRSRSTCVHSSWWFISLFIIFLFSSNKWEKITIEFSNLVEFFHYFWFQIMKTKKMQLEDILTYPLMYIEFSFYRGMSISRVST